MAFHDRIWIISYFMCACVFFLMYNRVALPALLIGGACPFIIAVTVAVTAFTAARVL